MNLRNTCTTRQLSSSPMPLKCKGNRDCYNNQTVQFNRKEIKEENVLVLLDLIDKYKKGLEQEILLLKNNEGT
jgi:hypothetical protein